MSMSEIEALKLIADHLLKIRVTLGGICSALWLMLLLKNMGGK
jgi:hypothetical protein